MTTRRKPPDPLPPSADREEALRLLSWAARDGSVVAMKALLEELRRDGITDEAQATSIIDELARKRTATG